MNNTLLDMLFLSDKRKNIILLLADSPRSIEDLKKALDANSTSIQPQIKKLREQHLVCRENNLYSLSEIGKIIVEKMHPLLETLEVFEENESYWVNRDLNAIPYSFLRRIGELGKCKMIEPDIDHLFELIPEFVRQLEKTKKIKVFVSYFHPLFPSYFLKLAREGREITLILSEATLERAVTDFKNETEEYLQLENTKMYLCNETKVLPCIMATDVFTALALFPKKGTFDRRYMLSCKRSALQWGEEVIEYYKNLSEEVTEI